MGAAREKTKYYERSQEVIENKRLLFSILVESQEVIEK
jgi:hypothetical protein